MKIAQVGTFDLDNLGDLLFPWVTGKLIHLVCGSRAAVDVCFYSPTCPVAYLYPDQVPYAPISQLDDDDAVAPFDFILIGGGDLIRNDDYSLYQTYGEDSPELTFTQILSPTETNSRRLALLAVGLPYDVDDVLSVFLKNSFSRVASAAIRDVRSAKLLEEHAGVNYTIVPDFVHSLPYVINKTACDSIVADVLGGYDSGYLCFQGNVDICASVEDTAKVLKEIEKALDKPFVLIEIGGCLGDTEYLRELAAVTGYAFVSRATYPGITLEQKISVLACSSGFIGSSLHGNIISNAYGINNISYVGKYSNKIREYFSAEGHGVLFEDFSVLQAQTHTVIDALVKDASDKTVLTELKHKKIMLFLEELLQSKGKNPSSFSVEIDRLYKAAHGKSCVRESIVRDQLASQEAQLRAEKTNAAEQINYRDLLVKDLEALLVAEKKNAIEQIDYRDLLVKDLEALLVAEKKNAIEQIDYRDLLVKASEALLVAEKKNAIEQIDYRDLLVKASEALLVAEKKNAIEQIDYRDLLVKDLETLLVVEKKNAIEQIDYRDLLVKDLEALLVAEKKNAIEQIDYRDLLVKDLEALLVAEKRNAAEQIDYRDLSVKDLEVLLVAEKKNAIEQIDYRDLLVKASEALLVAEKKNAIEQIDYRDLLVKDLEALLVAEKNNSVSQISYRDELIKTLEEKLLVSELAEKNSV